MEILDRYPLSKEDFISWFCKEYKYYGHNYNTFLKAPFVQQCISISRFLGYRLDLEEMSRKELEDYINNILYLYEEVKIKYPDGIADPIKEIMHMSFQERLKAHPELNVRPEIYHSLREAVVPLNAREVFTRIWISLRNAIVDIKPVVHAEPEPMDDEYWTADKLMKNETAPF